MMLSTVTHFLLLLNFVKVTETNDLGARVESMQPTKFVSLISS